MQSDILEAARRNEILAALPPLELNRLASRLRPASLQRDARLEGLGGAKNADEYRTWYPWALQSRPQAAQFRAMPPHYSATVRCALIRERAWIGGGDIAHVSHA